MRRACFSLALVLTLSAFARAQAPAAGEPPAPEAELMRERIEQLMANPETRVAGTALAAPRLVSTLYERRAFALEWSEPSGEQLMRAIDASADDGLDPEDYLRSTLQNVCSSARAAGAAADAALDCDLLRTEALVRLLYNLIFGKVDPTSFDPSWNFTRELPKIDPGVFVQEIIDWGDVAERVERVKPQRELYKRLKAAYSRERSAANGWQPIPAGGALKPGMSDSRVAALRARLAASGDLDPNAASGESFDAAVEAAVRSFQARQGLTVDGSVGPGTLAELNVPRSARLSQMRVNLERGRWVLNDLPPEFVVVNIAGFEVYLVRNDAVVWHARAQVGKPYRATPIFRSEMSYLVLNPTWTVPPGIFAADILPSQKRDRGTLARKGLEVIDSKGQVVPASSIDWANVTPRNFRYQLRQPPGPTNALGRVKFMFPNPYSVYLHDTPSKSLFEQADRAFSSGCIRVQNPLELAALLLEGQAGWNQAAIDAAIAAGTMRTVTLAKRVPVLLLYWTSWVDGEGVLQFRRDVYGRDAKVAAGLAAPFGIRARDRAAALAALAPDR